MTAPALSALGQIVAKSDPDRFLAAQFAPPAAREGLYALYAFNLEIARAPFVTREQLIAEMRLQWWREVIEAATTDRPPRAHEVAAPLTALIRAQNLPTAPFLAMIEGRVRDIYGEPFANAAVLREWLAATGGQLMLLAARALGAPCDELALRLGTAAALGNYLRAAPALAAMGRVPLPPDVAALAQSALVDMRALRRLPYPKAALPALLAAWRAKAALRPVAMGADPLRGGLVESPFAYRAGLLWRGLLNRW